MIMGDHVGLPKDIPLIITSATSTPETSKRDTKKSKRNSESKSSKSESRKTSESKSPETDGSSRKNRIVGGSLKYDIGRNQSVTNLINFPIKWSSVRIKGTGFEESSKSVVKLEPCNGIPNVNLDYQNLKSPTSGKKNNIGNVSCFL